MASSVIVTLDHIDWSAPWLDFWRDPGERLAQRVLAGVPQPHVLNEAGLAPVRFIAQAELPAGTAYEQHIFETGCVPTREGLHDFFNALCWMRFPLAKKRLNVQQAQQIAALGVAPERGPARDALTLFDENVALLQAPDALWEALAAKDWAAVFSGLRSLWSQSRLILFGHALTEKLVFPRKAITAHVFRAPSAMKEIADLDAWLAATLDADLLARKPFVHLPVLGVPGWCADNEDPAFYADPGVFRPPRQVAPQSP
ncbi:DUF3025 domain-containing protein [Curvibacter sp. APW13]|uniref:DUF3025 domain-containing protein n=1 Tax=Curvibacter sp. APW13 TaxID=3077236 RepID=UPI0028DDA62F|nr:DUF3025 domain-containing protein [Curvibacter sp. APW13]MDT8989825.1 DUF3025 domain-containing protein [Curvibacter sp. APW13]